MQFTKRNCVGENKNIFDNSWLIAIINQNKKIFIITTIIAALVFGALAIFLPSEYRATVILFPASNESVGQTFLSESTPNKGITRFGENEELEYFLQILNSDEIKNYITKKFNLYEHYNIDTTKAYPKTKLRKKINNNISFHKTEFMSIEIEVFDKDPKYAADIANAIADYSDTLINKIKQERAEKIYEIVKNEYFSALAELNQMQDSISKIRNLGILNYKSQSEVYSEAYAQAIAKGNIKGAQMLEEKLKLLAQYGGICQSFDEMVPYESKRIINLKEKYLQAKFEAKHIIPYKFIVNRAEIPEKEYYPLRWLIFIGGLLSTWTLLTIALIFLLKKKNIEVGISQNSMENNF